MTTDLVIVGSGGFARETAAAVAAINQVARTWRLVGFLDDDPAWHGRSRDGLPVLGGSELARDMSAAIVVCVGNPRRYHTRQALVRRLDLPSERYATIVHPAASVARGCRVGRGSVLLAGTVLTADVTVGSHAAVMPQVVLTHDDEVGDFVTIGSGVRLGGGVRIGSGCYLGAGSLVREGCVIGVGSLVGMGAVVLGDIPPHQVWVGNPARCLRPTGEDNPS